MKKKSNLSASILREIGLSKEGMSSWQLSKKLRELEPTIRYYLSSFHKLKIIKKEKSKYRLVKETFIFNGKVVIKNDGQFIFLECPYYGKQCKCSGGMITKDCLLLKELPQFMKKQIKL